MQPIRKLSEYRITCDLAEALRRRLVRGCIRDLQRLQDEYLRLGDDSGLRNVWDEICVQQQLDHSFSWRAYLATIDVFIDDRVEDLKPYELDALWLLTREGDDWDNQLEEDRSSYPVFRSDITAYLQGEVLSQAVNWNNERITRYRERRYGWDCYG